MWQSFVPCLQVFSYVGGFVKEKIVVSKQLQIALKNVHARSLGRGSLTAPNPKVRNLGGGGGGWGAREGVA